MDLLLRKLSDLIKEKIGQREVGDRFGVADLMGDYWSNIECDPKMFGTYFSEAEKE